MVGEASSSHSILDSRWLRVSGALKKALFIIPIVFVVVFFFESFSDDGALEDTTPTLIPIYTSAHNEIPMYAYFTSPHSYMICYSLYIDLFIALLEITMIWNPRIHLEKGEHWSQEQQGSLAII